MIGVRIIRWTFGWVGILGIILIVAALTGSMGVKMLSGLSDGFVMAAVGLIGWAILKMLSRRPAS